MIQTIPSRLPSADTFTPGRIMLYFFYLYYSREFLVVLFSNPLFDANYPQSGSLRAHRHYRLRSRPGNASFIIVQGTFLLFSLAGRISRHAIEFFDLAVKFIRIELESEWIPAEWNCPF